MSTGSIATPYQRFFLILGAGLFSACVFCVSMGTEPGALFFSFLPLMLIGLGLGTQPLGSACAIAFGATCLLTGLENGLFCAFFVLLPCYYFIRQALQWRQEDGVIIWYPMLRLLAQLTILSAAVLMVLALATGADGGLEAVIKHGFTDTMKPTDPELATDAQAMINDWGFGIFALGGWVWVLMLYAMAVAASWLLKPRQFSLRPSLALEPHGLPLWLLVLLITSGALAFLGQGADKFTAEAIFLLLLLPYALSGIAYVHAFSYARHLRLRRLWISCFYVALLFGRWPVLLMIALGLYLQLAEILDRHKKMG